MANKAYVLTLDAPIGASFTFPDNVTTTLPYSTNVNEVDLPFWQQFCIVHSISYRSEIITGIPAKKVAPLKGDFVQFISYENGETIPKFSVVYVGSNDKLYVADQSNPDKSDHIVGLTIRGYTSLNITVEVASFGLVENSDWNFSVGEVYLGTNGRLTQTKPVSGTVLIMGRAIRSNRLFISMIRPDSVVPTFLPPSDIALPTGKVLIGNDDGLAQSRELSGAISIDKTGLTSFVSLPPSYWSRTGTVVSPLNAGDTLSMTGGILVTPTSTPANAYWSIGQLWVYGLPAINDTFQLNTQTYTFKTTRGGTGEVTIGASISACATNIVNAIHTDQPTYGSQTGSFANVVLVNYPGVGAIGNSVVFTSNAPGASHAITAFANYGTTVGGAVLVTCAGHGLPSSSPYGPKNVTISGTTHYNGTFSAIYVSSSQYYIITTWTSDDATGSCTFGVVADGSGYLHGGADGTIGHAREIRQDNNYLYTCIADNTTLGYNWRKFLPLTLNTDTLTPSSLKVTGHAVFGNTTAKPVADAGYIPGSTNVVSISETNTEALYWGTRIGLNVGLNGSLSSGNNPTYTGAQILVQGNGAIPISTLQGASIGVLTGCIPETVLTSTVTGISVNPGATSAITALSGIVITNSIMPMSTTTSFAINSTYGMKINSWNATAPRTPGYVATGTGATGIFIIQPAVTASNQLSFATGIRIDDQTISNAVDANQNFISKGYAKNTFDGRIEAGTSLSIENIIAWKFGAVAAQGSIRIVSLPTLGDTITIDVQTYTVVTTRAGVGQVTLGASASTFSTNLRTAINTDQAALTVNVSSNIVTVTWSAQGPIGNTKIFSCSSSSNSIIMDGGGYLGGTAYGKTGTDLNLTAANINLNGILNVPTTFKQYFYNTVDQTTNYERAVATWGTISSINVFTIGTEKGGSGSSKGLGFSTQTGYIFLYSPVGSVLLASPGGTCYYSINDDASLNALAGTNISWVCGGGIFNRAVTEHAFMSETLNNSTPCPPINIYNNSTSDYERAYMKWDTNVFKIGTEKGGNGNARAIEVSAEGGVTLSSIGNSTSWFYVSQIGYDFVNPAGSAKPITIYNVFGPDPETGYIKFDTNVFKIGTAKQGSGTVRAIELLAGEEYLSIDGSGTVAASAAVVTSLKTLLGIS